MRKLKITHMVKSDIDQMPYLSGSAFELGHRAGVITWSNSVAYAEKNPLLQTAEEIEEAKSYFRTFGAWTTEEIAEWTNLDVQALVVQHIAANIREMERYDSYEEYEAAAHNGSCSSEVYRGDDGEFYASLNH